MCACVWVGEKEWEREIKWPYHHVASENIVTDSTFTASPIIHNIVLYVSDTYYPYSHDMNYSLLLSLCVSRAFAPFLCAAPDPPIYIKQSISNGSVHSI